MQQSDLPINPSLPFSLPVHINGIDEFLVTFKNMRHLDQFRKHFTFIGGVTINTVNLRPQLKVSDIINKISD